MKVVTCLERGGREGKEEGEEGEMKGVGTCSDHLLPAGSAALSMSSRRQWMAYKGDSTRRETYAVLPAAHAHKLSNHSLALAASSAEEEGL